MGKAREERVLLTFSAQNMAGWTALYLSGSVFVLHWGQELGIEKNDSLAASVELKTILYRNLTKLS